MYMPNILQNKIILYTQLETRIYETLNYTKNIKNLSFIYTHKKQQATRTARKTNTDILY